MGYCDLHNWSSMDTDDCPDCIERDRPSEEDNTMSKFNELDVKKQIEQTAMVKALAEWIVDTESGTDVDSLIDTIDAYFDGTEEGSCPHDWIGEALSRRQECAVLIEKLGDMSLEITALKDELLMANDKVVLEKALKGVRVSPNKMTEEDLYKFGPASTGIAVDEQETPVNGYVAFESGEYRRYSSLDDLITDGRVYELGHEMIATKTVKWEVKS